MKFDYSKEVDCGVALLDSINPGWKEKIDLEKLDMSFPFTCILGQLYGYFYDVKIRNPKEYGFACDHKAYYSYKDLTAEWKSRLVKKLDLSKEKVKPGDYIVVKNLGLDMQEGFEVGSVVKVVNNICAYQTITGKIIKNMVLTNTNHIYNDCPILVQRLEKV